MNDQSFVLKSLILKSDHKDYPENKNKKLYVKKKIGEGSYGLVFLIQNDHVIKIFKNSTINNTVFNESNYLIPIRNENRELTFFFKYINNKKVNTFIVNLYAIGIIRDSIIDNSIKLELNSYFIILPLCVPFYNNFNILNIPLINKKNGLDFTVSVMKRLLEISQFLENKYDLINLDFKLNNFMLTKNSDNLNDIIMIDFSIVKKLNNKNKTYNLTKELNPLDSGDASRRSPTRVTSMSDSLNKYYIWPANNQILENIPSYSVSINGLELLFGYNKVLDLPNNDKIKYFLKIIEDKNKNIHNIFFNGLILKINTESLLKLINSYGSF